LGDHAFSVEAGFEHLASLEGFGGESRERESKGEEQ